MQFLGKEQRGKGVWNREDQEPEKDNKDREGLEEKGRDTSSAPPHHSSHNSYVPQWEQSQH